MTTRAFSWTCSTFSETSGTSLMIFTARRSSGRLRPSTMSERSQITTSPPTVPVAACVESGRKIVWV